MNYGVTHYVDTRTFKIQRQAGTAGTVLAQLWVCLVLSFVGLGGASASSGSAARQTVDTAGGDTASIYEMFSNIPDNMLAALAVGAFIGAIISICWVLFVLYPLKVGRCRYFMESRQSLTPVSTVVSAFRRPYGNPIVVQLLTDLKIALGFLLLIVPGIYWEYCYELVPYLLAENPYMSATRAMELSKEMMEGEKWNFFILKSSLLWLAAALRVHLRHRRLLFGTVHAGDLRGILRRHAQQGTGHGHDDYRRARRLCAA